MFSEILLKNVEQRLRMQDDFVLVRNVDSSERYQFNPADKNEVSHLPVDVKHWIDAVFNSDQSCSTKTFLNEKGTVYRLVAEIISNRPTLFIFGAGHVGQALALISALLGYEVIVIDDRPEFASRKRLPDSRIQLIVRDFARAVETLNMNSRSAAVIVTRGHQFDEICLENLLRSEVGYLGMIGSKRRVISILKRLSQRGFTDSELSKVHAPIGLSIGARSPQEIAIAIIAEIIAEANKTGLDV